MSELQKSVCHTTKNEAECDFQTLTKVFLRDYQDYDQLKRGLQESADFFNHERIHQGLDYHTPDEVYEQGTFPDIKENGVAKLFRIILLILS